jgi:Zn-dependent peptidase ImmA (M78 family)
MGDIDWEKIKQAAEAVLEENFITEPPVPVVELAKNYGYEVLESDLPLDVAGFVDPKKHIIYINATDSDTRKAFTIAHELGHIKMHGKELEKNPDIGILYRKPLGQRDSDTKESAANYFAACLLVPEKMLNETFKRYGKLADNSRILGNLFGVSQEVIGYRQHDLNLRNGSET